MKRAERTAFNGCPALNMNRTVTSIMPAELDTSRPFKGQSLAGQKFNRLTITSFAGIKRKSVYYWNAVCDCGNTVLVSRNSLTESKVKSCGCLKKEARVHGFAFRKEKHRLYNTWLSLRQRCNNPKKKEYKHYGGRGITVDPRWDSFLAFVTDMEPAWKPGLSINRKDNDGPYSPDNCEWADHSTQMSNTRVNRYLTLSGETATLIQWCSRQGLGVVLVLNRLDKLGWTVERALTTKPRKMTFK